MSRLLDTQETAYIVEALRKHARCLEANASSHRGDEQARHESRCKAEDYLDLADLIDNHDITLECETTK